MSDLNRTYFAARAAKECVLELEARTEQFYEWTRSSGQLTTWKRMVREYYAGAYSMGALGTAGEQEEYTTVKENQLHSIGEHVVVMVTGNRPNFECRAKNSDHESATQSILGAALLEQAHKEKDLEGVAINAVRWAGMFAESYGFIGWDPNAGKDFVGDPYSGTTTKTGDLVYRALMPNDVVRDVTKVKATDHEWYCIRREVNRHNLIAKYPDLTDKILAAQDAVQEWKKETRINIPVHGTTTRYLSDQIVMWEFYHAITPAMPYGRYIAFIDADCILQDQALPYPWLPIERITPEEMAGSARGYSCFFDLLPLQHIVSSIRSIILSHVNNYGTGVWWTKQGSNFTLKDMAAGFRLLRGGTEAPTALQPPTVPDYLPAVADQTVAAMEALSGVNSVRRGTVADERAIQPQAAALLDAKAVEFIAGLQLSYVRFLESMATKTIQLYQAFAKAPQTALIVGKSNQGYIAEFTGEKLQNIDRVTVDISNPLTRTTSGRFQLAQLLLNMPNSPIKDPQQLEQVLSTGRLDPAVESTRAELLRIKSENEMLSDGKPVEACAYDNHILDIREHLAVIASPQARENPAVLQITLMHCQQHVNLWRTTDPAVLAALGIPPPPPPPMPPPGIAPPGAPGATNSTPPPKAGDASVTGTPPSPHDQPSTPMMPINPSTGERAPGPSGPVPPA